WHTTRSRRDSDQLKLSERAIALRHFAFTLQHVNLDRRLVIDHGCKRKTVTQRNRGVALDDLREQPATRLETETERQNVEQHDVFDFAIQHAALNRCAHRYHFV